MHEPGFLHRGLPGPEGHSPTRCSHGEYPGHPSRAPPPAIPQGDPGPDRPWLSSRSPRPRPSPFCLLIPVGHGGWTLESGRLCLCVCVSRGVTCVSACLRPCVSPWDVGPDACVFRVCRQRRTRPATCHFSRAPPGGAGGSGPSGQVRPNPARREDPRGPCQEVEASPSASPAPGGVGR